MTNSLFYYLALFSLLFLFNFFKVRKNSPKDSRKFQDYFLISQEIVFTSAGIFIFLLEKEKNWLGFIIIGFLILMVASNSNSILDLKEEYNLIFGINVAIIIIIIAAAIASFEYYIPNLELEKKRIENSQYDTLITYKIAIPYRDNTLIKHVGKEKFGNRNLVYIAFIECKSEKCAIDSAKIRFSEDLISKPIIPEAKGVENKIDADFEKIVCRKEMNIIKKE